jgi:CHAD domain-containing protein
VDALRGWVVEASIGSDAVWRVALAERMQQRALTLTDEIARTGPMYSSEPLHAVRIATKKLRYVIELAGEFNFAPVTGPLRSLKRQQELLGEIHDLEVLTGFADQAFAEAPRRANAARLVGVWHRDARLLHAAYLRSRPVLERIARHARGELPRRVVRGRPRPRPARAAAQARPARPRAATPAAARRR